MWCGVVWCGVVWCGVVWCGVVWCGVIDDDDDDDDTFVSFQYLFLVECIGSHQLSARQPCCHSCLIHLRTHPSTYPSIHPSNHPSLHPSIHSPSPPMLPYSTHLPPPPMLTIVMFKLKNLQKAMHTGHSYVAIPPIYAHAPRLFRLLHRYLGLLGG